MDKKGKEPMKTLLQGFLTALQCADASLQYSRPIDGRTNPIALDDCKKVVQNAIAQLMPLLAHRSVLKSDNPNTPDGVAGIAPLELELLRAVLPEPYTIVNEGTDNLSIWDGDDWQYRIDQWETATSLLAKIIAVRASSAEIHGRVSVQHEIKKALGL
jgi:hypothetical protein